MSCCTGRINRPFLIRTASFDPFEMSHKIYREFEVFRSPASDVKVHYFGVCSSKN